MQGEEEGSTEGSSRECCPGQSLGAPKKGAIYAQKRSTQTANVIGRSFHQINSNRYIWCTGEEEEEKETPIQVWEQEQVKVFVKIKIEVKTSQIKVKSLTFQICHTKKQTNVDRDTILSAIEITCMDFDCCNILNWIWLNENSNCQSIDRFFLVCAQ